MDPESSNEQVASAAMMALLEHYEELNLIVLTPDRTGIDHVTDYGLDTLYWLTGIFHQTIHPTSHMRAVRRARDSSGKFYEALGELLQTLRQNSAEAN